MYVYVLTDAQKIYGETHERLSRVTGGGEWVAGDRGGAGD